MENNKYISIGGMSFDIASVAALKKEDFVKTHLKIVERAGYMARLTEPQRIETLGKYYDQIVGSAPKQEAAATTNTGTKKQEGAK